jgi:hypothetical protein
MGSSISRRKIYIHNQVFGRLDAIPIHYRDMAISDENVIHALEYTYDRKMELIQCRSRVIIEESHMYYKVSLDPAATPPWKLEKITSGGRIVDTWDFQLTEPENFLT